MIRPFTCLTVLLAAGSGLYLYTEKHKTTLLDDRIRAVVTETHQIEDRTSMLRAEWALLNQPDRLQTLAARFLPQLQPMAPTQFVQEADLDGHLPPIGAPREMYGPPAPPETAPGVAMASAGAVAGAPTANASASDVKLALAAVTPLSGKSVVRVAMHVRRPVAAPRRAYAAVTPPAVPMVRQVSAYAPPILAGAWHPAPAAAPVFAGSALGMAHMVIAPPMAAR